MLKRILILSLLLFLIVPKQTFAANTDIVINEVFPDPSDSDDNEFIELYNKGSESVTITGWKLSDKANNSYTFPETTIPSKGFASFKKTTTGIGLNNDGGDEVFLKDNTDTQIDTMSFASVIEGRSWSRVPDGTGGFANDTSPTENSANSAPPTSTPANSPTPTKTPTPEPTATPTKTPTPAPTNKAPTPTVKSVAKTSPSPTTKATPTPEKDENSTLNLASDGDDSLQDIGDSNVSVTPGASVMGASDTSMPWLFITLGLIFIFVCGILAYFQFGDKLFKILSWKKKSL